MAGDGGGQRALRDAAVRRLVELSESRPLSRDDVRLAARGLGVSERSVWRWVAQAKDRGQPAQRSRFTVDDALRQRLAFWRGNVAAVHRELVQAAAQGGPPAPSFPTLHRAINRALSPGELAGLRKGEYAARAHDVYGQRPPGHRNQAWEGDHVEASVEVDVDGRLVKPWVTWFIDCATNVITGVAVTPGVPSRESILAALRAAISTEEPYGPAGGLPQVVRVDRGKDFLSKTVEAACAVFAVRVEDLPGYAPFLKGSVEALNGAAKTMLFAGLPRYTESPRLAGGKQPDPDAPALRYEAFVAELLAWVSWWNTAHEMDELDGRTPLRAWQDDPTPLSVVPAEDLRLYTLEDDGRVRTITNKGVQWRRRHYLAAWMNGSANADREVRVRWMPHHDHEIEVFDARSGAYLGRAELASPATIKQVRRARRVRADKLARELKAVEKTRRQRYAASTTVQPPQPVGAMTTAEAAAELSDVDDAGLRSQARPRLVPLGPPAPGWVLPRSAGAAGISGGTEERDASAT